jgi:hypothetical protein
LEAETALLFSGGCSHFFVLRVCVFVPVKMRAFALLFAAIVAVVGATKVFEEDHRTFVDLASIASQVNVSIIDVELTVFPGAHFPFRL